MTETEVTCPYSVHSQKSAEGPLVVNSARQKSTLKIVAHPLDKEKALG